MKKIIIILLLLAFSSSSAYAHPGRQNPDGGHSCYTNCEEYGLKYGEYHYHTYYNRKQDDRQAVKGENTTTIPTWIIITILITGSIIYLIAKVPKSESPKRIQGNIIDITPVGKSVESTEIEETKQIYPPDEDVEITGTITSTIYRNRPFFVASFLSDEGVRNVIVGYYNERLYTNKKYFIRGTLTYDIRYGKQIKVKYMKRV